MLQNVACQPVSKKESLDNGRIEMKEDEDMFKAKAAHWHFSCSNAKPKGPPIRSQRTRGCPAFVCRITRDDSS